MLALTITPILPLHSTPPPAVPPIAEKNIPLLLGGKKNSKILQLKTESLN
jgi:hypothetical protein